MDVGADLKCVVGGERKKLALLGALTIPLKQQKEMQNIWAQM